MPAPAAKWIKWAGLSALGLLVLGFIAFAVLKWAFGQFIESERFRELASANTGAGLHARADFSPFQLDGSDLRTRGLQTTGGEEAAFSSLSLRDLHARWSLRKLWDRVCQLDSVEIDSASVELLPKTASALDMPPPSRVQTTGASGGSFFSSLAPNRLELRNASIRQAEARWPAGSVQNVALEATAEQSTGPNAVWKIIGRGGRVESQGWPALDVQSLRLRYRAPTLFVENASFRQGAAGTVSVDGEVRIDDELQLHAEWNRIALDALLPPDWRQHLHGTLGGTAEVQSRLPATKPIEIAGTWSIADGRLEALPILNDLALFTNAAQFRQVPLSQARGRFRQVGTRLELTQLIVESNGLARIEGSLTFEGENVDGQLQLGLAPQLLQWLPGVRSRVFATTRDGYAWAPVRLQGPLTAPREDLSARLATATAGEVLDTAGQAAGQVREKVQDAAKGVLDLFFGK